MGATVSSTAAGEDAYLSDDPGRPVTPADPTGAGRGVGLRAGDGAPRLATGRRHKADAGGYAYGAPPFGFRSDRGQLVPRLEEQPALALITELHQAQLAAGETGLRRMAAALTEAGHRPRRGDTWHPGRPHREPAAFVTPGRSSVGLRDQAVRARVRLAVWALRALVLALRASGSRRLLRAALSGQGLGYLGDCLGGRPAELLHRLRRLLNSGQLRRAAVEGVDALAQVVDGGVDAVAKVVDGALEADGEGIDSVPKVQPSSATLASIASRRLPVRRPKTLMRAARTTPKVVMAATMTAVLLSVAPAPEVGTGPI